MHYEESSKTPQKVMGCDLASSLEGPVREAFSDQVTFEHRPGRGKGGSHALRCLNEALSTISLEQVQKSRA